MNDATIALALDIVEVAHRAHALPLPEGRRPRGDAAAVVRSVPAGCCANDAPALRTRLARVTATLMQTPP